VSYIMHTLGRSETLLYRARFPLFYHLGAWLVLAISAVLATIAYVNGYAWLGAVVVLTGMVLFLGILMPIWTTEIGVTNQRFIFKRGLFWRMTQELQLRAIEEVNLKQGLLGRLFDFGRLDLRGTGVDDIHLPTLADPLSIRKALQDGMAAAVQGVTSAPTLIAMPSTA
jgi:membrane protein YdbS with pleckstrin-like domain